MVMLRPPGVHIERGPARAAALSLLDTAIPVFLGLAERGPTNEPVRLTSMEEFYETFGRLDVGSYLAPSVDGFFLNGGRECYIVRIAHLFERGRKEIATKATARLRDGEKQNTLQIQAHSEGMWGNQIRVSIKHVPSRISTFITVDGHPGDRSIMVKSTHGFARGTLVKIFDDEHAAYRVLTAVESRTLTWAEKEPLEEGFRSSAPTMVEPVGFDMLVETYKSKENFRNVNLSRQSPNYIERVVNGTSRLITVTNLETLTPVPTCFPAEISNVALDGGTDGLFTVAAEDFIGVDNGPGQRFGLAGIADLELIDLLCMPDLAWCVERSAGFKSIKDVEIVQQAAVTQCEERKDRFAILDFPPDSNPTGALQYRQLFDSSFCAFYYPYVIPSSGTGGKPMPPSGHVAGIYARCDEDQGVFRAPANEPFRGVVDLALFLQQADIGSLNNEGINCIQAFPQRGIRIWGARTASSDPLLKFVNVRRTISTIARSLQVGLQWVVFENNDESLWSTMTRDVYFFLEELWRGGYLSGSTPDQAFYVKCDAELNTPAVMKRGQMLVDIGLAPFRPAEFIGVRVVQEIDVLAREDGT